MMGCSDLCGHMPGDNYTEVTSGDVEEVGNLEPRRLGSLQRQVEDEESMLSPRLLEVTGVIDDGSKLALEVVAAAANFLLVKEVKQGSIFDYNEKQGSSRTKVQLGDRIIAVNGERSSAEGLMAALQAISGSFTLEVEKPRYLGVVIEQSAEDLGIQVQPSAGFGVIITGIKDGCIASYNRFTRASRQVRVNDFITGSFSKDASGNVTLQMMYGYDEVMKLFAKGGPYRLSVFSYSDNHFQF